MKKTLSNKKAAAGCIAFCCIIAFTLGGGTAFAGEGNAPSSQRMADYANVAYADQSSSQVMDIYLPEGEGPFPVITVVHGGGFAFGSQTMDIIRPVIEAGVERGYAVVSVDYRKSGEAVFPAALADVKAAVRFIRANAGEYGFDSGHIAVWGESAGAYLAVMTALTPDVEELDGDVTTNAGYASSVNAFVDFYGPVEFYAMDEEYAALGNKGVRFASDDSFESRFLGQNIGKDKEFTYKTYWETYSDQFTDTDTGLAAWIQAGDADQNVPFTESVNLAERLGSLLKEERIEFGIIEGAAHEDKLFYTEENLDDVFEFLADTMEN